jgi:hypothetical protein
MQQYQSAILKAQQERDALLSKIKGKALNCFGPENKLRI